MIDNLLPPGFKDEIFDQATLEHKYKNKIITAHCPNTGSMMGLLSKNTVVFFSDKSFTKIENKHCFSNKYGSYDTLAEAKVACGRDGNCSAAYDENCNNKAPFYLCPKSSSPEHSSLLSCLYQKTGRLSFGRHC